MKRVIIRSSGNNTDHGIGYTEHGGYGGTSDNRWSLKMATQYEVGRNIKDGEEYQLEVNNVIKGIFVK